MSFFRIGHSGVPREILLLSILCGLAHAQSTSPNPNADVRALDGKDLPGTDTDTLKLTKEFAAAGLASAQNNLGVAYEKSHGAVQDYSEAARWYRKAAEHGDAVAQNNLGLLYDQGKGLPQDHSEAARWFQKAADQEYAPGQYFLGSAYNDGRGVENLT